MFLSSNFDSNLVYGFPENATRELYGAKQVRLDVEAFAIILFMGMNSDSIRDELDFCCISF